MKMVNLRDVAPPSASDWSLRTGEKVWLLNLDQIEAQTGRILSKVYSDTSNIGSSTQAFDNGNVLFSKLRPYLNKVVLPDESGIATTELVPLRPDPERLERRYLAYYLRCPGFVAWATNEVAGAKMPRLVMQSFWKQQIPLPPLAEQKRIAAILDKADAIRRKLQQSLRLSDDFLRSVFLDMFGDPVTNPKGWGKTTVGKEVDFLTSGSRGWAQYYTDQGDFFIRIQNLRGGFLDVSDSAFVKAPDTAEARRTRVQAGDVLLSITADLGRTAVVPENFGKGYINQHLAILRLREMNPVFVSQQLASPSGQRQFSSLNRSAVKAGLNFDDIRSVELLRPPLDLQIKFSAIVTKLKKRSSTLQAMLGEAETLFSSLQQRAFRGEL